VYNVQVKI